MNSLSSLMPNFRLGTVNDDIDFEYINGADVHFGCGAILMGEYWYFGGSVNKRQVIRFSTDYPIFD